jgi:hypothetical protein
VLVLLDVEKAHEVDVGALLSLRVYTEGGAPSLPSTSGPAYVFVFGKRKEEKIRK